MDTPSGAQGAGTSAPALGEKKNVQINIKALLDAGAHFGHQTERWNPKMLSYIFTERNGTHIINLDTTCRRWEVARKFILDRVSLGGSVLFVGTKTQARDIIKEEAIRCGAFYVSSRWLGGTLTNFQTIKGSIERMRKLEELLASAEQEGSKIRLSKKERLNIARDLEKLNGNLGGIRYMKKSPDLIFIVDTNKESLAVLEARRLHIPIVALVDTNSDPDLVDIAIPSNDDATRTIQLFAAAIADAVIEGSEIYRARAPRADSKEGEGSTEAEPQKGGKRGGGKKGRTEVEIAPTEVTVNQ